MVKKLFYVFLFCVCLMLSIFACASGSGSESGQRGLKVENAGDIEVFTQLRHSSDIASIVYSSSGKYLLSACRDGTIKVWDVESGRLQRTLSGHTDGVRSAVYSPDEKYIVSGSADKTIRIWNSKSSQELHKLSGHTDGIYSVAYSPNGRRIASGSFDNTIRVWDAVNGKQLLLLKNAGEVRSVTYSPDGMYIVSGSNDKIIRIWDASNGKEVKKLVGHTNSVSSVVYSPNGTCIMSGSADNTIRIWDVKNGQEIRKLLGHTSYVMNPVYSSDGKYIVSGSWDETVRIWDAESGQELKKISGHAITSSVSFNPDGKHIVAGFWDGIIKIWDAENGNLQQTLAGNSNYASSVAFSTDERYIISGAINNTINVWDAESGRRLRTISGHTGGVNSVAYSPDGKYIVSGSDDKTIRIWDAENGSELRRLSGHKREVNTFAFSPDGKRIASGSGNINYDHVLRSSEADNTIRIWDVESGRELKRLAGHNAMIYSVAFSPNGRRIVSGSSDTTIKIWDADTGREIRSIPNHDFYSGYIYSVAYSPDGKLIVSGRSHGPVRVWDAESGESLFAMGSHINSAVDVTFSPDGKKILWGTDYNIVRLRDVDGTIKDFFGHEGSIKSVKFNSNGMKFISSSYDGTIRLWDVTTGKEIAKFISFSGSDSQLAAASRGLTVETETASSAIEGEWLSITPDGYYQASPRGDRYLNVRVNNTVTGIDSYRSVFYNPDVVQARLQGKPDPASKANVTIQQAANFMPPTVTIKSPSTFTTTNTATANLSVTVADQNQSIKNIKIFVNGRAVAKNELAAIKGNNLQAERTSLTVTGNQKTVNFELPLTLDPGRNLIEVVAFNGYSESARLSPVEVTYNAPAGQQRQLPKLWVLAIGVNKYDSAGPRMGGMGNLNYAVADAKRLVESLKTQEGRRYAKVNSLIIGDGETELPTAANIRKNLSFLEQAGDRDVVLLFLAGHGVSAQESKFFFLPKDAVVSGSSGNWSVDEKLAISGDEITAVLEGQGNRLLFIDACQSGGVDNNRMIRAMMETNAFVFAASQGNESSYESEKWGGGHGAFTYNILNALRGAPNALAEGNVSVRSMSGFVSLEVPKATENRQNPRVYSLLFADFPLAVIK